jgi:hypothetical protein
VSGNALHCLPLNHLPENRQMTTLQTTKDQQILQFLHEHVFDPILNSGAASEQLKRGIRYTVMRLNERDAAGKRNYYWSAISGTERSADFASRMRREGFTRFEECIDEFRARFNDEWLRS